MIDIKSIPSEKKSIHSMKIAIFLPDVAYSALKYFINAKPAKAMKSFAIVYKDAYVEWNLHI